MNKMPLLSSLAFGAGEVGDPSRNYHSYGPPSPFSVRIESALDKRSIGQPWRYQPQPLPSLSDPSLPASSRYSLLLLSAKEGYPLWRPEPNRRLPEEYRRDGLYIGSVGIFRDGIFDYLFNICYPKSHPVNAGGVPEDFQPVEISQTDISEVDPFHDVDAHVASPIGYISKNLVHSEGLNNSHGINLRRGYDFMSMSPDGAILVLPDGSTRIDLKNKKKFRQYANRNAHRWFTYVENTRGRECEDLSLYIITGSDRSSSFGVASFHNMQSQDANLQFTVDESTHSHSWSKPHYAESRSGPRFSPGDPLGIERPANQNVFLRGFKIKKRQASNGKESAHRVESTDLASDSNESNASSQGWNNWSSSEYGKKGDYVPSQTASYHPCDTINAFMLGLLSATLGSAASGPCFAISHDDDWRSVWDESNPILPTEQELIRRICSKSKYLIDNGMIYPDPLDDATPRKIATFPEEVTTARVLVILTCPVQNCGEQFQSQSLLTSHTQQKHDVVHGTPLRVPLSAAKASSAATAPKPPSQPEKRKRRGGVAALSCAECRRLKLKCSRTFPCTGCTKKGCAAICPDGSLTTGKGNRFVLADTNELQGKIEELASRAKVLEEALAKSHSLVSPQPHPLLSDDLLQITRPIKEESPERGLPPTASTSSIDVIKEEDNKEEEDEALTVYNASMGSLNIDNKNVFYGRTSSSWHFLLNENGVDSQKPILTFEQPLPNDLPWLSYSFPFSPSVDKGTRQHLIELLPKVHVARRHYQNYYRNGAWQYTPISEIEFRTTIFEPFYDPQSEDQTYEDPLGSHRLAVLFFVLALGALLDLDGPSHPPEAKWYYQLGRASFALEPVLDSPSLSTIQALVLLASYMLVDDIYDQRWPLMGLTSKLVQTAGLHLDGTHWNLSPDETYRRRCLFWEAYSYDILQSLTYGRPPHMTLTYVDTKKPFETTRGANGEVEMTYDAWKHKFFSECLGVIWNKAFGAHPLSYNMLKHLDQQMRAYYVPPSLRVPGFGGAKLNQDLHPPSAELTMQRHFLVALKEITSFYMHRGFFATAVNENPENPIEHHPYGESVQTIYDSACICVGLMRSLFRHQPEIMQRFSYFFDHIFSCAYVLGSIASKPKVPMALSALTNLELAYDLFEATYDTPRRTKILTEIAKLRNQARLALNVTQNPLTDAQKLSRLKRMKTEESPVLETNPRVVPDRQHNSWGNHTSSLTSTSPTSPTSSHQYSPTATTHIQPTSYQPTFNLSPSRSKPQYPIDQYNLYPPSTIGVVPPQQPQQQPQQMQYGDPFFEHPGMAYNPVSGYQYHDYQDAGYFQQQVAMDSYSQQPGYDSSGDVIMPMLEESWQNFMTQIRQ